MKSFSLLVILFLMLPSIVQAQSTTPGKSYMLADLGDYFEAPSRWDGRDWLKLGAIGTGLLVIAEKGDDVWKHEMQVEYRPYHNDHLARLGNAWGDLSLSGPFMLGVYGYGRLTDNSEYLNASHNMFQSAVYVGLMTTALKLTFRRDRPCQANDESGWFNHGRSFPSGHSSLAFAVSRSYLNSLDNPSLAQKFLFYGLATTTTFARTYDNRHWLSDVVAGALLGIYTADYVTNKNKEHNDGNYAIEPVLTPKTVGLQVSWR